jgi:uncharacterized protein
MSDQSHDWKTVSFLGRRGGPLLQGRYNVLGSDLARPIVMMMTGDGPKGSKSASWTNFPPLLANKGIRSFLFDFEGLGFSAGERRTLTLGHAVTNLEAAFAFVKANVVDKNVSIGAIASSFGATALLLSPDLANQLDALALKSPAPFLAQAYFNELGKDEFRNWIKSQHSQVNGYDLEVLKDSFRYDTWNSAKQITTPVLMTHGTNDEIVPYAHSELLASCLGGEVELDTFDGVGHGYSEPGAWDRMANRIVTWLASRLVS